MKNKKSIKIVENLEIENIPNILLIGFSPDLQNRWIVTKKDYLNLIVWLQAYYNLDEDPITKGVEEKLISRETGDLLLASFQLKLDQINIIQRGWTYIKTGIPYKNPRELVVAILKEYYNTRYIQYLNGVEVSVKKLKKILYTHTTHTKNSISLKENEICKNVTSDFSNEVICPLWDDCLTAISDKAVTKNDQSTIDLLKNHITHVQKFLTLFREILVRQGNGRTNTDEIFFHSIKIINGVEFIYNTEKKSHIKRYQ